MSNEKTIHHPNGYSAKLYGKSSLSVYFKGKEILHTYDRNVHTADEVMEMLEDMPNFIEKIVKGMEDKLIELGDGTDESQRIN